MLVQRGFLFVTHLPMSNFMGVFEFVETVKIRGVDTF